MTVLFIEQVQQKQGISNESNLIINVLIDIDNKQQIYPCVHMSMEQCCCVHIPITSILMYFN